MRRRSGNSTMDKWDVDHGSARNFTEANLFIARREPNVSPRRPRSARRRKRERSVTCQRISPQSRRYSIELASLLSWRLCVFACDKSGRIPAVNVRPPMSNRAATSLPLRALRAFVVNRDFPQFVVRTSWMRRAAFQEKSQLDWHSGESQV